MLSGKCREGSVWEEPLLGVGLPPARSTVAGGWSENERHRQPEPPPPESAPTWSPASWHHWPIPGQLDSTSSPHAPFAIPPWWEPPWSPPSPRPHPPFRVTGWSRFPPAGLFKSPSSTRSASASHWPFHAHSDAASKATSAEPSPLAFRVK